MNLLNLTTSPSMSTPPYRATPESIARAKQSAREERLRNGLDPDTGKPLIPHLSRITAEPLRMTLAEDAPAQDRKARLAVKVSELIEEGYSTIEIRQQCDSEDAVAESDSY